VENTYPQFTASRSTCLTVVVSFTFSAMQMQDGWFVKVTGVTTPSGRTDGTLLAWSAGYDFRNKLLA
jgi:hypothetical protein